MITWKIKNESGAPNTRRSLWSGWLEQDEAAKLLNLVGVHDELLEALEKNSLMLGACYDPTEDNRNNPTMQSIGKALKLAKKAIANAEGGRK